MNLKNSIIPRSDQQNADDLIAGPRTIEITAVEDSGNKEQPVVIRFKGDNGRPYKPSKSMRRVLVVLWGDEGDAYLGKRITLYRDPNIKFGGDPVGGIRISHASGLEAAVPIPLTESRGKRKAHVVEPLPADAPQFDLQALTDVGETKARAGTEVLRAWWTAIPAAAKTALKSKLDATWKQLAESADATKGTA